MTNIHLPSLEGRLERLSSSRWQDVVVFAFAFAYFRLRRPPGGAQPDQDAWDDARAWWERPGRDDDDDDFGIADEGEYVDEDNITAAVWSSRRPPRRRPSVRRRKGRRIAWGGGDDFDDIAPSPPPWGVPQDAIGGGTIRGGRKSVATTST
jgi:hypothetical protein